MTALPDLVIRHEKIDPRHNRYNIKRLLYKGCAGLDPRTIYPRIESGELGEPILDRLEFLLAFKLHSETKLISGQSIQSIDTNLSDLVQFVRFLDQNDLAPKLSNLILVYLEYAEYLFVEANKKSGRFNKVTAYGYAASLSKIIGEILVIPTEQRLIRRTRLKYPVGQKKGLSKAAEKQNLEDTFKMGAYLVDLIDGLTVESIHGAMPLRVQRRHELNGQDEIILAPGLRIYGKKSYQDDVSQLTTNQRSHSQKTTNLRKSLESIEGTFRWHLVNLRVQAEFLVFVAQTGMNKTQTSLLERERFAYKAAGDDSFNVRAYKDRSSGEVLFTIYRSYKARLNKHITFINYFFPDSKLLFPIFSTDGKTAVSIRTYNTLKRHLYDSQIPWIPPKQLRNTRVNWLLRRSGDEDVTAEMAQHTKEVLKEQYEHPSQQRAMVETTRFWNKHDPIKRRNLKEAPIGQCNGEPEPTDTKPASVVVPNCVNQSGCLWCKHHRDLDTADYVWSLCSMRYLKTIEASVPTRKEIPADVVIDRITEKIEAYRTMSNDRAQWVSEAELRIEECDYHSDWSPLIEFLE